MPLIERTRIPSTTVAHSFHGRLVFKDHPGDATNRATEEAADLKLPDLVLYQLDGDPDGHSTAFALVEPLSWGAAAAWVASAAAKALLGEAVKRLFFGYTSPEELVRLITAETTRIVRRELAERDVQTLAAELRGLQLSVAAYEGNPSEALLANLVTDGARLIFRLMSHGPHAFLLWVRSVGLALAILRENERRGRENGQDSGAAHLAVAELLGQAFPHATSVLQTLSAENDARVGPLRQESYYPICEPRNCHRVTYFLFTVDGRAVGAGRERAGAERAREAALADVRRQFSEQVVIPLRLVEDAWRQSATPLA
jgi:hypothetical protein